MAIALGRAIHQAGSIPDAGSTVVTGMTIGRSVVLGVGWVSGTQTITITCTGEAIQQHATTLVQNATLGLSYQLFSINSLASTGDKTFVFDTSGGAADIHCFIQEYTGGDTTGFFDIGSVNSGLGTTASTTLTPSVANCLGVMITVNNGGTPTVGGAGWTDNTTTPFDDASWFNTGGENLDLGAIALETASATHASGTWTITFGAFKPAGGAEPPVVERFKGKRMLSWMPNR